MKLKRRLALFSIMLAISVFLLSVSSCKGDGLEVDENGNLIDNSWKEEIPTGKTILAFDISGNYSFAGDTGTKTPVKEWTKVNAYVWGGTIGNDGWGGWPGLSLDKTVSGNPNIFYAEVLDDKVGSGTFKFNNSEEGKNAAVNPMDIEIKKGKRYLVRGTNYSEF